METTYINTGSIARLSADIDDLFNQLQENVCSSCGCDCISENELGLCDDCFNDIPFDLAAAPAPVVPTPLGSQRPDSQNADNAVYRHQFGSFKTLHYSGLQSLPRPLNPRAVFRRIRFSLKNGQSPKARLHHRRFRRRFYASFGAMEGL